MISIFGLTEPGEFSQCDYKNIVQNAVLEFSKISIKQLGTIFKHQTSWSKVIM